MKFASNRRHFHKNSLKFGVSTTNGGNNPEKRYNRRQLSLHCPCTMVQKAWLLSYAQYFEKSLVPAQYAPNLSKITSVPAFNTLKIQFSWHWSWNLKSKNAFKTSPTFIFIPTQNFENIIHYENTPAKHENYIFLSHVLHFPILLTCCLNIKWPT